MSTVDSESYRTYSYENAELLCFKSSSLVVLVLSLGFLGVMTRQKLDLKLAGLLFATLLTYLTGVFLQFMYSIRLVEWNIMLSVHFGVGMFMVSHSLANYVIRYIYLQITSISPKIEMVFNIYLALDTLFSIAVYGLWIGSIHSFNSDGRITASNLYVGQIAFNELAITAFSYVMIKNFFKNPQNSFRQLSGQGFYSFVLERVLHLCNAVIMAIDIVNQTAISNFLTSFRYCFILMFIWNIRHYFKQKYV